MKWKERIIKTIEGNKADFLPFVPRLDIWYKANKFNNTLPKKYIGYNLKEITEDLGVGFHSIIPDFRNFLSTKSIAFLGLGIYEIKNNAYRINSGSISFKFKTGENQITETTFNTPYGNINTKTLYNDQMRSYGATIGHTVEHAIKDVNDLKAVGYLFEKIAVEDNYDNFSTFKEFLDDRGASVAFCMLSASPMHHIMKELMPFEKFVYMYNDNKKELETLAEKISIFFDKIIDMSIKSQADIIFSGANYDSFLTWPGFFKEHITPYLKKCAGISHKSGKFFLTHTDGENDGIIGEYVNADIDIADSICPYPMTKLGIKYIREIFKDKITVWGGIPSICVLEETMSDYKFEKFLNEFFNDIDHADRMILSIADTTPPGARLDRIEKIGKIAKSFKF